MQWIFLFLACSNSIETKGDFAISYSETQCYAYKHCYRMLFDGKYDGMDDCEEKVQTKFLEENETDFGDCTLIPEKAEQCILDINQATCGELWEREEEIYQACHSDAWDCSQEQEQMELQE
jgi:hypothetical protein